MSDQPPYAEYPRPEGGGYTGSGRGPGVYFEAIGEAWNMVRQDIGHWVAATIVLFFIVLALRIPLYLLNQAMMPATPSPGQMGQIGVAFVVNLLLGLIPVAVQTVLTTGMIAMGVRKARGEYINVSMMFEPFSRFGAVFGSGLLYTLVVIASAIACFFPSLYFSPILVLMPTVAFLKGVGPVDSLSLTYNRCKNYWASLLALTFVLGLVVFAGVCVCGVGLLVAFPIYCIVWAIHYRAFFESGPDAVPVYR